MEIKLCVLIDVSPGLPLILTWKFDLYSWTRFMIYVFLWPWYIWICMFHAQVLSWKESSGTFHTTFIIIYRYRSLFYHTNFCGITVDGDSKVKPKVKLADSWEEDDTSVSDSADDTDDDKMWKKRRWRMRRWKTVIKCRNILTIETASEQKLCDALIA